MIIAPPPLISPSFRRSQQRLIFHALHDIKREKASFSALQQLFQNATSSTNNNNNRSSTSSVKDYEKLVLQKHATFSSPTDKAKVDMNVLVHDKCRKSKVGSSSSS